MKKFLTDLFLFSAIVVLLALGINWLVRTYNDEPVNFSKHYDELLDGEVNANAIVIGSSHGVHAVRPTLLNTDTYSFYNFALNGANPRFFLHWYRNLFKPFYTKPTYCIYTVDWFIFNEFWLWRNFEQDSEFFPWSVFYNSYISDNHFNKSSLIANRFPLLKYRSLDDLSKAFNLRKGDPRYPEEGYDKGFIPYKIEYDELLFQHSPVDVNSKIFEAQQRCFEELINIFQQADIKLIFLFTPEYGISAEEYASIETMKVIYTLAEKYEVPVLNYNTDQRSKINDNHNNFSDWGHMNASGSRLFSSVLKEDLAELMK